MEATVSNQIIEVLNALCEKFGIAIDWTGQNVMPYVQELMKKAVNYELWTSVMCIIFFLLSTGICWFVVWKLSRFPGFCWDDVFDEGAPTIAMFFAIAGVILAITSFCVTVDESMNIITCLTFPEKIIFNMIQSMM